MRVLAVKSASYYALSKNIVGPLVRTLASNGERAAVHGEGINEKFFEELNSISSRGATLMIKTVHGVDEFVFSQEAFFALTKNAIDDERIQAMRQLEYWKRKDLQFAKELAAALEQTHICETGPE